MGDGKKSLNFDCQGLFYGEGRLFARGASCPGLCHLSLFECGFVTDRSGRTSRHQSPSSSPPPHAAPAAHGTQIQLRVNLGGRRHALSCASGGAKKPSHRRGRHLDRSGQRNAELIKSSRLSPRLGHRPGRQLWGIMEEDPPKNGPCHRAGEAHHGGTISRSLRETAFFFSG